VKRWFVTFVCCARFFLYFFPHCPPLLVPSCFNSSLGFRVISVPAASYFSWDSPWWCKDGDEITKVGLKQNVDVVTTLEVAWMSSTKCWMKTCKFLLFPSTITHQNSFVPIKFQPNSFCSHQLPKKFHQIPLVLISNPSLSFCSQQVPKQFPSNSSCSYQVSIKFLLFPLLWRIGRWAQSEWWDSWET
jgi:hypothetical protein